MTTFGESERNVKRYFTVGDSVIFQNQRFNVMSVGKPICSFGEPKTDIYILLENEQGKVEIKISYKKSNADFMENKIKAERAEQLFGEQWSVLIKKSTLKIKDKFLNKKLIYKNNYKRTSNGSITLGWKFELVNKLNGELSETIELTKEQYIDVLSGNGLPENKRNAIINDKVIVNSGVANYILQGNLFSSAQDILNKLQSIEDYVESAPKMYFACKALNYRSFENKSDGNRPLAVQVDWKVINGKLSPELIFDKPLCWNGKAVLEQLKSCLQELNIKNTNDISEKNAIKNCIYE